MFVVVSVADDLHFRSALGRTTDQKGTCCARTRHFYVFCCFLQIANAPSGCSAGEIKERVWFGQDGMEHVRTIKEPKQSIPTFAETVSLLMQVGIEHIIVRPFPDYFSSVVPSSQRISMSSSMSMSRSRTTLTGSLR